MNKIEQIGLDKIKEKYNELKTIKHTAKFFNLSPEYLRNFFIKNNINYIKKKKYSCDEDFFSRDTEESFYWAGFIAADGNISKKDMLTITLSEKDAEHVEKFKKCIKSNAPIKTINRSKGAFIILNNKKRFIKGSKFSNIRFVSHKIANDLKKFNIVPNKTKIYDIPEWLLNHHLFHHFIRGYFDGDGWFATKKQRKNNVNISWGICGNKCIVDKFNNYLIEKCKISGTPQIVKQINIFKLSYNKHYDVYKIINSLYKDASIYLDRKFEISKLAIKQEENSLILNIEKEELIEACEKLQSIKLVSKNFNCSIGAIYNYIKKYNLHFSFMKKKIINGENKANSKLTNDQVKEIREIFKNNKITKTKIAQMYNVSLSIISDIINNKTYVNI